MRVDLPEARRLLGVNHCPDCMQPSGVRRASTSQADIVAQASMELQTSGKAVAVETLKAADLSPSHLVCSCPYMSGIIANCGEACTPADRLHYMYVEMLHTQLFD